MGRLATLVVALAVLLAGCGLTRSVDDAAIDDIGPGWLELFDMPLNRENAQALAVLGGDSGADGSAFAEGWLRAWIQGDESVTLVLFRVGAAVEGRMTEMTAALEAGGGVTVLGPMTGQKDVLELEVEGEPAVLAGRGEYFAILSFTPGVPPQTRTDIVLAQLAAMPAFDPDDQNRPMYVVLFGVAFGVALFFAVRSARVPLSSVTDREQYRGP